MPSLDARVTNLEAKAARPAPRRRVFIVSPTNPGFIDSPRVRAEFYGQTLHRMADESEEDFRQRAVAAATAAATGHSVDLTLWGAEEPTQWHCEGGVLVARPIDEVHA